jgi:hypothetical protein
VGIGKLQSLRGLWTQRVNIAFVRQHDRDLHCPGQAEFMRLLDHRTASGFGEHVCPG